jgi:hypothetical protein
MTTKCPAAKRAFFSPFLISRKQIPAMMGICLLLVSISLQGQQSKVIPPDSQKSAAKQRISNSESVKTGAVDPAVCTTPNEDPKIPTDALRTARSHEYAPTSTERGEEGAVETLKLSAPLQGEWLRDELQAQRETNLREESREEKVVSDAASAQQCAPSKDSPPRTESGTPR